MDAATTQQEQGLLEQLGKARARLEALEQDLYAVDGELAGLAGERAEYGLLTQVCDGLEQLRERGRASLFWGDGAVPDEGAETVRLAQGRADRFQKRLDEIETRRQAVADAIAQQHDEVDYIEDDVYEVRRREEERKLEWVVEREVDPRAFRASVMPWTRGGEDDERFRRSLAASLLLALLLGATLPLIDLPLPEIGEPVEVPERWTRLIREERPVPPPLLRPPPPPEELAVEPTEKAPVVEPPQPKAETQGILAFREKFSGLAAVKAPARLGSEARITSSGEAASGRPERAMITTQAPGSSGGINLAALSRDLGGGGGQIEGVEVARATSSIGGSTEKGRPVSRGGPGLSRTDEEIQIVFDRHKAALYRLYNRELRRDPTLEGQMVLRLTIEPDGSVSMCRLQSTDMDAAQLSQQVVTRVKTFDFGAKAGIPAVTIVYPIDFLPAT